MAGPGVAARARPWSRPAWWFARAVVAARWPLVVLWIALGAFAILRLPPPAPAGDGLGDITSSQNPALVTEVRSAQDFGFPLLTRTVLVQADPAGLPDAVVRAAAERAAALARSDGAGPIAAALPVLGDARLPGVREPGTTMVTYLYPKPEDGLFASVRSADAYAAQFGPADRVVGVTGTAPARAEQERIIDSSLRRLELASLLAVLVIVGVAFRSVAAPLLTLAMAGLSFCFVTRLSGVLTDRFGLRIPADLEPLMVALMLGVTTDYVVYFLSGMRSELAAGHDRREAARRTTATFAPIVVVAGLTIAAGVATLLLASTPAVRAFAPAMALAVLVAMVVAVTALPPLTAILGRAALWPAGAPEPGSTDGGSLRRGMVRLLRHRLGAVVVVAGCLAGLALLSAPVLGLRSGLPFVAALPDDGRVARAARVAADGFVPGITSPTLVDLRSTDPVAAQALNRLQDLLRDRPHVAAVLGPREEAQIALASGRPVHAFVREDRTAARYLVVLDVDPLDAVAVGAMDDLGRALPGLLRQAGLPAGSTAALGGDTAAIAVVIGQTDDDLRRVLVAALLVNLVLLTAFLRALVAPLFLLVCTIASAAATLGLTALVFQDRLGHPGVTFFVPLATGVLLIALGSDYNLFAVGHVWEEARRLPLKDAMLAALPRSSGAITTAGVALAASLGALALVPLRQFRELAFALVVGILLDALVVRTILVPALLGLFGRLSGWPGHRLDPAPTLPADHARNARPGD